MECIKCGLEITENRNKSKICESCMKEILQKIQDDANDIWYTANSILYDLCKRYPNHKNEQEIIAKMFIIGRSYAAAIERGKKKPKMKKEFDVNTLYLELGKKMKDASFDNLINRCRKKDSVEQCLKVHQKLIESIGEITQKFFYESAKRSFASKYLHFHIPDKFFIYDSQASSTIGELLRYFGISRFPRDKPKSKSNSLDNEYKIFYDKCERGTKEIKKEYKISLNCRQFDNLLLEIRDLLNKNESIK